MTRCEVQFGREEEGELREYEGFIKIPIKPSAAHSSRNLELAPSLCV